MDATQPADFFQSVLNSMSQQMALVDDSGQIQWVNQAWKDFSAANEGREENTWRKVNYFDVCARSTNFGDLDAGEVLAGIGRVLSADEPEFFFEYPCHSPSEQRWFMMRFHPLKSNDNNWFVFTHQNITERKLMELKVRELSTLDSLTGISNRRRFDQFIESEWLQNRRLNSPISLALVDVDFFKQYNDNYGHLAGDECLRSVCKVLSGHARRPGDLVARYGGDEFAVILGNTDEEAAWLIADDILVD